MLRLGFGGKAGFKAFEQIHKGGWNTSPGRMQIFLLSLIKVNEPAPGKIWRGSSPGLDR
jgi:hypothetical protein